MTVNFACNLAHERYEYVEKPVGLLHLRIPAGYIPSSPWIRSCRRKACWLT